MNTIDNGSSDDEVVESEEDYGLVKSAQSRVAIPASEQNVPINLVLRLRWVCKSF